MGFGWKDIVPSDPYVVRVARPISPMDLTYITQIYQPLIGPLSVSLYITFFHEYSMDQHLYGNHRSLMSAMATPLDQLVKAREVLEAIGLIRTIKITSEQGDQLFEYHLHAPLSPASFFGDDMMSMILLNRVGKGRYSYLREKFIGKKTELEQTGTRQDITKGFDEIFHSITPSELMVASGSETEDFLDKMQSLFPLVDVSGQQGMKGTPKIQFKKNQPDFVFLEAALPKTLGKNRRLSVEICDLLQELSFFYQLDDMQLSYFLQEPYVYDDQNEIDPGRLKGFVKDWYLRTNQGQQPYVEETSTTIVKTAKEPLSSVQSREEEHRQALSTLSPIALLELYQGGGKASPADLKIVDELIQHYNLLPGVINVLLEYVMITNNKQLPKSLILKIASHWKRVGIRTVDQALEQARQLHNEMKTKGKTRKESTSTRNSPKSNMKKDQLPEWVVRQMVPAEKSDQAPQEEIDEEKKREALELLRALGEID